MAQISMRVARVFIIIMLYTLWIITICNNQESDTNKVRHILLIGEIYGEVIDIFTWRDPR